MFDNPSKAKMIFGAAGVLVTLGVGAAAWYTFPVLKRHDAMLAQNAGVKQSVETLGGRIDQQNSKLAEWSKAQDQVRSEIADLRKEMRSRIEAVRRQTGRSAEELIHRVQAEVTSDIDSIKEKVAGLETSREADRAQVAALESELGQLRKEMAEQTQQLNDKIADSGAGTAKLVAGLEASQELDRKEVDGLNKKLATRRIDFEVNKGHSYELAPGISLEINGTDIAYRRVTGWMWVLPDRRTIWLREQGAQEPVVFYSNNDGKKRELVITAVTKHSAVGYLLVPDESKTESAAVVGAESNASE
jgi:Spy/CpxP family protein refolding chaperone